jgi:hypothetical protein
MMAILKINRHDGISSWITIFMAAVVLVAAGFQIPSAAAGAVIPELGSGLEIVDARGDFRCTGDPAQARVCRLNEPSDERMEGLPLQALTLHYKAHKLEMICRHFDESRFGAMRARLETRQGAAADHSELLKAGMGGSFVNVVLAWQVGGTVILLEQFHERVVTSSVCHLGAPAFERLLAYRAARRVRGVRDL